MKTVDNTSVGFDIPQYCKAAVVVNEGPSFHVEVQTLPVSDIGRLT